MWAVRVRGRHFNGRQPSGLNLISIFRLRDESSSGGGINISQKDFALKMQGGLCARGAYLQV